MHQKKHEKLILGIDASNIRSGGGLTHLKEILANGDPNKFGINKVVIWSNTKTLNYLPNSPWIEKVTHNLLNKSFIFSFIYQSFYLTNTAKNKYGCNLIFVPGGTFLGSFENIVTMSQNMLPFEKIEYLRFSSWKHRLRFRLLYFTQSFTFKKSRAIIYLTNYAKDKIKSNLNLKSSKSVIIPHGTNPAFINEPKAQKPINEFNKLNPFKLLYVSIVTEYKHQWNIAAAVLRLKAQGYPITLDLIGGATQKSKEKLNKILDSEANSDNTVRYLGLIPYEKLSDYYSSSDGFIFGSSCENLPIILIEAMSAGLPIASSNFGPMPEVLGDAAIYFDPTNVDSITESTKYLLDNFKFRKKISTFAYNKSINYTWKDCSYKTFEFLSKISKTNENKK